MRGKSEDAAISRVVCYGTLHVQTSSASLVQLLFTYVDSLIIHISLLKKEKLRSMREKLDKSNKKASSKNLYACD